MKRGLITLTNQEAIKFYTLLGKDIPGDLQENYALKLKEVDIQINEEELNRVLDLILLPVPNELMSNEDIIKNNLRNKAQNKLDNLKN